jgi:ABC-2 type transport system permease protein
MIVALLALTFSLLVISPEISKQTPDREKLKTYLCLIMYSATILCLSINMNVFAFQSITTEKSRGNIESLLATPLSAKKIWISKSLTVFIPGMVFGIVLSSLALIAVNFIYFVPEMGFIYTHWIGLSSFIFIPIVYFCLSLLAHLIGLTGKPASGNIIAQIFLPLSLTLMINLTVRGILDGASWHFTLASAGLAAIILLIVFSFFPVLQGRE